MCYMTSYTPTMEKHNTKICTFTQQTDPIFSNISSQKNTSSAPFIGEICLPLFLMTGSICLVTDNISLVQICREIFCHSSDYSSQMLFAGGDLLFYFELQNTKTEK